MDFEKKNSRPDLGTSAKSESALRRLEVFVGEWNGQGRSLDPATGDLVPVTTHESFRWDLETSVLEHRWTWKFADREFSGLERIGYDEKSEHYFSDLQDDDGHRIHYHVIEHGGIWTYIGERQRALLEVSGDGRQIMDRWEQSEDGNQWTALCEIRWSKIATA